MEPLKNQNTDSKFENKKNPHQREWIDSVAENRNDDFEKIVAETVEDNFFND